MRSMRLLYYPGCTLKTTALNFDESAVAMAAALGIELEELKRWYCCGTVYSLATDDVIHQLAPIRNLVRVQEQGESQVVTLCSMCYNTLKRANLLFNADADRREKILAIMDRETPYQGKVRVRQLLEVLAEDIGFEEITKHLKLPLGSLKLAPYYGCLLVRPKEAAIDDTEQPMIMQKLIRSLGAEPVESPYMTECCGSYQTVQEKDLVADRAYNIISAARARGADALITSCPLCQFNLDRRQEQVKERHKGFEVMPVFYFTQIVALALGVPVERLRLELHHIAPWALLREKTDAEV